MPRWVKRFFGKPKSYEELIIHNAYDAIVLSAGPSSGAHNHVGSDALGIPESKLTDFIVKRLYFHEAILLAAFNVAETSGHEDDQQSHRFTPEMAKKLQSEWGTREGQKPTVEEIGRRCLGTAAALSNDPVAWSREWLREFYSSGDPDEDLVALWAGQCLKDQATLQRLAEQYVK